MGLGDFLRKLFGGPPENVNEPLFEPTADPIKDASDYVMAQPELTPESAEPAVEKPAFADDANEDYEEPRKSFSEGEDRVEEPAD